MILFLFLLLFCSLPAHAVSVTDGSTTITNARTISVANGTVSGVQANGYALITIANTDAQTLSFSNPNLSIGNGNSVDISAIDTNTNANTICAGTTTYLDGEGNCDDISSVYQAVNSQFAFLTVNGTSGTDPVADSNADTLILTASGIVTITGNATTDTITIDATEVDGSTTNELQNIFQTISTTSGTAPVADSTTDTLTLTAGSGITITGDSATDTVTIAATGGSEWTDTGSILHPNESTVDEVVIGGTTEAGADIFLGVDGDTVFNQQGNNVDFRVEGDTDTNLIFVDGGTDTVNIGTSTTGSKLTVASTNNSDVMTLDTSAAGAGLRMTLKRSSTPTGSILNIYTLLTDDVAGDYWSYGYDNDDGSFKIATGDNLATSRITILSSGNVGMGSDNPSQKLELKSSSPGIMFIDSATPADYWKTGLNSFQDFIINYLSDGTAEFYIDQPSGNVGISDSTPTAKLDVGGDLQVQETLHVDGVVDDGNSGAADTIDWGTGNHHKSTLTGNVTYTFTAPPGPTTLTLQLVQDATGSRTATWPATVKWPGGTAPTLTTTAAAKDILSCLYDGTNYNCQVGNDFK